MKIFTQYTYEQTWTPRTQEEILEIIAEEVGDADPKGVLSYIKQSIAEGKTITVGTCRMKKESQEDVSKS